MIAENYLISQHPIDSSKRQSDRGKKVYHSTKKGTDLFQIRDSFESIDLEDNAKVKESSPRKKKESSSSCSKNVKPHKSLDEQSSYNNSHSVRHSDMKKDGNDNVQTESKSPRRSDSKRLKHYDNLKIQDCSKGNNKSLLSSPSVHDKLDQSKQEKPDHTRRETSSPRHDNHHHHHHDRHRERSSRDSDTKDRKKERQRESDKEYEKENDKERRRESHTDRKKVSPDSKRRQALYQDQQVADFLSMLEASATCQEDIGINKTETRISDKSEKYSRDERGKDSRSPEKHRHGKGHHGSSSNTNELKPTDEKLSESKHGEKKISDSKRIRKDKKETEHKCDDSNRNAKEKHTNSKGKFEDGSEFRSCSSLELDVDNEEESPNASKRDNSMRKSSSVKCKKRIEDEKSNGINNVSTKSHGTKNKQQNEHDDGNEHLISDESSIRGRRGSIAVWREQAKCKNDKDSDDHSRMQLKQQRGTSGKCKSPTKAATSSMDQIDYDTEEKIEEATKEDERKKILEASRLGPVRALSRRSSFVQNGDEDTASTILNLPLQSELDQMKLSNNNSFMGGGYLPAGLGGTISGQASSERGAGRDPSRSRRQSILCAADFSEVSESTDDECDIRCVPYLPTRGAGVGKSGMSLDASISSLNSSFSSRSSKKDKFISSSLVENLVIASAPVSKSTQRRSQSLEGGEAIENILKSRRLRGDNVAPRRPDKEETKQKSKKFLFV
jgi:hypothetical protein